MYMIITPEIKAKKNTALNRTWVEGVSPNAIFVDGFDHCIVGVTVAGAVIYSVDDILKTLVSIEHDWDYDAATEWFDHNIFGAYSLSDESHPMFMITLDGSFVTD